MRITFDTINRVPKNEQGLLLALYKDLEELNSKIHKKLYFVWEDTHTEYSSEWCDPCPDYYHMYIIYCDNESIGSFMTIDDLDYAMLLLHDFVEIL